MTRKDAMGRLQRSNPIDQHLLVFGNVIVGNIDHVDQSSDDWKHIAEPMALFAHYALASLYGGAKQSCLSTFGQIRGHPDAHFAAAVLFLPPAQSNPACVTVHLPDTNLDVKVQCR